MKIKVKLYNNQTLPIINEKGDWFDIPLNFDLALEGPNADILKRKQIILYFKMFCVIISICIFLWEVFL